MSASITKIITTDKYRLLQDNDVLDMWAAESFVIGKETGVPLSRIADLFGIGAVDHIGTCYSDLVNTYGIHIDNTLFTVKYATKEGFYVACTWHNLKAFIERDGTEYIEVDPYIEPKPTKARSRKKPAV